MKTIAKPFQTSIDIKKSQFICRLFPAQNEKEAKEIINKISEEYKDATHNCTAYVVSDGEGFDDDGEPGGTAGRPMLNVLKKNEMENIVAIVTRYFEGIKLGAGGLVTANQFLKPFQLQRLLIWDSMRYSASALSISISRQLTMRLGQRTWLLLKSIMKQM